MNSLTTAIQRRAATRIGTVGAYTTGSDLAFVRHVRETVGRVTLFGRPGVRTLMALAAEGDLYGADLDPACYLDRSTGQDELFPRDWEAEQRDLGLPVVRSAGVFVNRADVVGLKTAFTSTVTGDAIRVVSLHGRWLEGGGSRDLITYVRNCDNPLAFVLAGPFDPLDHQGAVDGLCSLVDAGSAGGRRVELLRTDLTGVAVVALGVTHGAIGLSTTTRHHGLPLGKQAGDAHQQRQGIPYVFSRPLLSWQKGTALGALTPFGGAGLTSCDCAACDQRGLCRFDRTWPKVVPDEVRADAREHDMFTWLKLASEILGSDDPMSAWRAECRSAIATAARITSTYKVQLTVPQSVSAWF